MFVSVHVNESYGEKKIEVECEGGKKRGMIFPLEGKCVQFIFDYEPYKACCLFRIVSGNVSTHTKKTYTTIQHLNSIRYIGLYSIFFINTAFVYKN